MHDPGLISWWQSVGVFCLCASPFCSTCLHSLHQRAPPGSILSQSARVSALAEQRVVHGQGAYRRAQEVRGAPTRRVHSTPRRATRTGKDCDTRDKRRSAQPERGCARAEDSLKGTRGLWHVAEWLTIQQQASVRLVELSEALGIEPAAHCDIRVCLQRLASVRSLTGLNACVRLNA